MSLRAPHPVARWYSRTLPLPAALLIAVLSGLVNSAAFPGIGWWPLIFVGTALMFWSLLGRRGWASILVGFVGGFTFFGMHILWITVYLGPVPWIALVGLESVFFALGCSLMSIAWRVVPLYWPGVSGRLVGLPLVLAGLWVLREAITSVWPYGGFSWGRLAFSQSDSSFAPLVAWLGVSGLSFVLAFLSAVLLQAVRSVRIAWPVRGIVATAAFLAVSLVPAWQVHESGSIRVAAVQGDSESGLFSQQAAGASLDDHVQATLPLIGRKVDVVVWPENAADIDPLENSLSAQTLDYISKVMKAPLVTGTITKNSAGKLFNSVLLWENGKGSVQQYDKIHPVPFAEYLPDRSFWYPLAPSLFDMVPQDFTFGKRSNVFSINGVKAGIVICFDIVDDSLIHQMVSGGAQFIIAPTNNADFGHTVESEQQAAIARLRAIESGRSVVNDSTVGVSAMFGPDGRVIGQLPTFRRTAMVHSVPLSTTVTPAMAFGRQIEWIAAGFGLAGLVLGLAIHRMDHSPVPHPHSRSRLRATRRRRGQLRTEK